MTAGDVSVLGLSEVEERLYRHCLRNPGATADGIHRHLDAPLSEVESALERLVVLTVLVDADGGYLPAPPELVVDSLTDMRLKHLHEEMRAVTQARHLVASLRSEQEGTTPVAPAVEKIDGLGNIRSRIDGLAFFARKEILSVEPYTALTQENIQHARPLDLRCIRRGVKIRSVVLSATLEDSLTVGYLRELASLGAEIRVVEEMSAHILVYDHRTALTPVDPGDSSRGALVAQEPGLVASIVALFEKIWSGGMDLEACCAEADTDRLPTLEQHVLEAMCQGTKDEIGARDLGVSVRTYRRYVANILQILDASSRPQAALLARERGWI
ncbi:helix-turn-helix transcriptional regulator [Streptomyces griseoluteus]|uniref:helix-turn-helix transcriptional regulator n=1 Tax=Streptomyces griseoluteus TaxID=29306 RepID=UPI0033FE5C05